MHMSTNDTAVVFRCDGSPQIGMGHVVRCMTLATALRDRGVAVRFVMTGLGSETAEFEIEPPPLHDSEASCLPLEDAAVLIAAVRRNGGSAVLIDHYRADERYLSALQEAGLKIAIIDDIGDRSLFAANWLLNHNVGAHSLGYRVRRDCEMLLGPHYALLRPQFPKARARLNRSFTAADCRVLITLGGGDVEPQLARTLQALATCPFRLDVRCLAGAGSDDAQLQRAATQSPHRVELFGTTLDVAGHMTWADLSINAGGMTCWELCCLGVPILVMTLSFDQRDNADRLTAAGIARSLPSPDSEQFDSFLANTTFDLLRSPDERRRMSELGRQLVDGHGAERSAQSFVQLVQKQ